MTAPVVWINVARRTLGRELKGDELALELERLADDRPRSLFEEPASSRKDLSENHTAEV
jgi:hypothetical protein